MGTQNTTLTERSIKALQPKPTVYRVRDGIQDPNLKGFGVVVAPSGTKSFFLAFTSPETRKRTQGTLGIHPSLSLSRARDQAREWRQQIREGVDPVLEAKRQTQAKQEAHRAEQEALEQENNLGTVEQLFELYARDLEMDGKRSADYVRGIYRTDIGPAMGDRKTRDVTTDDCADIIAAVAARGALTLANRVRTYLIAAFNFGGKARNLPRWRHTSPDFALIGNPAETTEKALKRERRGRRHLSRDEVCHVWKALEESVEVTGGRGAERMSSFDTSTQVAVKLLFATGQRVEEVLGAVWSELDFEQRLWTIPADRRKNAAKNASAEPHLVPLGDLHLTLLESLRPLSERSKYLFPARGAQRPGYRGSIRQRGKEITDGA
jgi:integrase